MRMGVVEFVQRLVGQLMLSPLPPVALTFMSNIRCGMVHSVRLVHADPGTGRAVRTMGGPLGIVEVLAGSGLSC